MKIVRITKPYRMINLKTRRLLDLRGDGWQYYIIEGTLVWVNLISLYREGVRDVYGRF